MADTKALFKRHAVYYDEIMEIIERKTKGATKEDAIVVTTNLTMVYCACIIAEAIRNGLDDPE